jgi:signal transduction histidine kinase
VEGRRVISGPRFARRQRTSRLPALTVGGWFRVVFAIIALLIAGAAFVIAQLVSHGRSVSDELTAGILPAQAPAYRLQGALVGQETGVRGYGLTGDRSFLQPYTTGLPTEKNAATQLRALVARQKPLLADLNRIEQAAARWRASYAAPLMALASRGPLTGHDLSFMNRSRQDFDHLRALFNAQNANLAVAATRDNSRAQNFRTEQDLAYAIILAVFLIASGLFTVVLQRSVGHPLRRLRDASRRVTDGDFDHQIEPSGPSDIWAVGADVESMRRELAAAVDSARSSAEVAIRQAVELDESGAELRRSNAELEQFAYVASHDLQEPLRKVASFCQLLEKRYGDQLDERGRQYIDFAVDGAKRLQILINDLLTFSRVGRAGDIQVRVGTGQALGAALSALSTVIEETHAVISAPDQMPQVLGDPTLLAMVWQNLISNAIKFRTPGQIPEVHITVDPDPDSMWRFCVADNGIGIAPEFAEKVFVIFQRLHGRDAYPGTGIGLALCKRIIEHYGGEISLDTSYPDGARVCFTLPGLDVTESGQADQPAAASARIEGIPA